MESNIEQQQVKSKERVKDFGEVFTNPREVKAMLDLVKDESYRIESTFLEPACGTGNFLVEILARKLKVVKSTAKTKEEWIILALISVASIYGIDIQEDNVMESKERLIEMVVSEYKEVHNEDLEEKAREIFLSVLNKNMIHGDGLTGLQHGVNEGVEIAFSSWNFNHLLEEKFVVIEEYTMNSMIAHNKQKELNKQINNKTGSLFALAGQNVEEKDLLPNCTYKLKMRL